MPRLYKTNRSADDAENKTGTNPRELVSNRTIDSIASIFQNAVSNAGPNDDPATAYRFHGLTA
jgi:hypothetical protein